MGPRGSASSGLEIQSMQMLYAICFIPGSFDDSEKTYTAGCILANDEIDE